LLRAHKKSVSQARNAYSAFLLIPGFDNVRFNPMLKPLKDAWRSTAPKYATFWDVEPCLDLLKSQALSDNDLPSLRIRLILCFRFFMLFRSVDLARTWRQISLTQGKPFVWCQRKGWKTPRWQEVLSMEDCKELSPWHLMQRYVRLTLDIAPPGTQLLRSLVSPFSPLSADRVASLTKEWLVTFDRSFKEWGAHSTRGAAVTFYKRLGLSSEQVCELGQWKNTQAFAQHYLRLGAGEEAAKIIQDWVHNKVSSSSEAEGERLRTPPTEEGGGSNLEADARKDDEPAHPSPGRRRWVPKKRQRSPNNDPPERFRFAPVPPTASSSTSSNAPRPPRESHT
jgi:hypothetical protein